MRILVVASYNKDCFAPFILEQAEALKSQGCDVDFFGIRGKGLKGYLKSLPLLKRRIKLYNPDVIHAHYGLSGLQANLQRRVPVVTTYHGSDINDNKVLRFSKMAMRLSAWNIFVSRKTMEIACLNSKRTLLPCGIDLCDLQLIKKAEARQRMGLDANRRYILFAGAFDNEVKDAALAKAAVANLCIDNVELLELKGYSREKVLLLMCAVDSFLMTSISEGSPQVIKEAMACGCPIVSVDVGDVKERMQGVYGCFVSNTRDAIELSGLLKKAFAFEGKTQGRQKIINDRLENVQVATELLDIYQKVVR